MADQGIKISAMTEADKLSGSQVMPAVQDGANVKVSVDNIQTYLLGTGGAKRNGEAPRFKNLGSSFTDEQNTMIKNATFDDMYLGDYWSINGRTWRIWHFFDAYPFGDSKNGVPCVVILPDEADFTADGSTTHYWNDTDTTSGGYKNCKFRKTYRSQCDSQFTSAFGSGHLYTHRELLCSAMSGDNPSSWEWDDCTSELPSEMNIYGGRVWGGQSANGYNIGSAWSQYALAAVAPEYVVRRSYNWWLRDVWSGSGVALVYTNGNANSSDASYPWTSVRSARLLRAV